MTELFADGSLPLRDREGVARPLIVGVVVGGAVQMAESLPTPVRIRARDLRGLARAADAARADKPGAATVVEIDAVIAPRASEAIERWTRGGSTYTDGSLPYVGTPLGLAGLIKDLWVLGIVDGALITTSSARELELVRHSVLPQFTQHAATA